MPTRVIHSLEELKQLAGQEVGLSDWMEVTQDRINQFAEAIGDRQWIHIDTTRARVESPYGATIAHGFLTLSLLRMLLDDAVLLDLGAKMGINYGLNRVRFPSAVRSGSRIRGRIVLQALEEAGEYIQLCWGVTVEVEGESKPCVVAEWLTRQYF
jgi:acyl dehydratase